MTHRIPTPGNPELDEDSSATSELPEVGGVVRVRTRNYLVEGVEPSPGAGTKVSLSCLDDDAQGEPLEVIWELELDPEIIDTEAWREIGSKGFDEPRVFGAYIRTLRWNCVTATDPKLFQAPFRAGIRVDAYQLEPLRKALNLPRVNLFIADDVGLGKTIEAGLIATELLLRRRVRDIVVACPPTMLLQWQDELEARFGLSFRILDRAYIEQVRRERGYGVNPWTTFPRFLVSHRLLIDETYASPMRDWLDNLRPGSLLILDEAHHAAPSSGAKYAIDSRITGAIRDLAPRFEHRLFLSATPHNGHSNSFSALLEILDRNRFTRGVKVLPRHLGDVMVRRLKEDIRAIEGGFPRREVIQLDIDGLLDSAPELRLSALLSEYRETREVRLAGLSKRKQAEGALVIIGLQQRLLSSVDAFAQTLRVHRRTMERIWQGETVPVANASSTDATLVREAPDVDDDLSTVPEEELSLLVDEAVEAVTVATAGAANAADVARERTLLEEMERIAESARGLPDARVRRLVEWIRERMCPGARITGASLSAPGARWTDLRIVIFTEYDDTRRYLVEMLRMAIAGTDRSDERIEVFHGPTPPDKREAIKRAFNLPPDEHPVRILVATDAAREGINLQAHCWNLFHFDLPWNPSRVEQRNGRIDRKLQPADAVCCHYFVYLQRPEDRVLRALVRKTDLIREQLGSLSQVLDTRLARLLEEGIRRDEVDGLVTSIEGEGPARESQETSEAELETVRERQTDLTRQIETLRDRIAQARKWIGLDTESLRDAISCSLELDGVGPLNAAHTPTGTPNRFRLPELDDRWSRTIEALREPPEDGQRTPRWKRESAIRPVTFEAPRTIDDDAVQLHLSHRLVQRLLGRFTAQGFVLHDLSRACLAQTADAIPRVVLLGRLSLFGRGATRLHDEVLTVAARWVDPAARKGALTPYGREAEQKTLELLEAALGPNSVGLPEAIRTRLAGAIPRDMEELLPALTKRGHVALREAEGHLANRGKVESESMRRILEDQRKRVLAEVGRTQQLDLGGFNPDEKRQVESNRRYWDHWIKDVDEDIAREPKRILDLYEVTSFRLEPVGLAYLWPATG